MDEQNMSSIFDQLMAEQQVAPEAMPMEGMPADGTAIPQDGMPIEGMPDENAPIEGTQEVPPGTPEQAMQNAPQNGVSADMPDLNQILGTVNQVIQQQQSQIAQLQQQLQQSGQAVQQQSESAQTAIEQAMLQPPMLDLSQLQYADDEQRAAMSQKYAGDMASYIRSQMDRDYAPMMQKYQQMEQTQANEAARSKFSQLQGFNDNSALVDNIIAKTPELQSISDPETKYQIAFLMAEGLNKMKTPAPSAPTTDDIIKMAMENPDVLRAIKEREAQGIAQQNQGLPQFSASSGMSSAPANVPKRPETMDEAWNNLQQNGLKGASAGYFAH